MRRLYPDVLFDWEKIARQLAEKREVCRGYRSRRRGTSAPRTHATRPSYAVLDPAGHVVYADMPRTARDAAALLDAVLMMGRTTDDDT
jgi:hypothetical protein